MSGKIISAQEASRLLRASDKSSAETYDEVARDDRKKSAVRTLLKATTDEEVANAARGESDPDEMMRTLTGLDIVVTSVRRRVSLAEMTRKKLKNDPKMLFYELEDRESSTVYDYSGTAFWAAGFTEMVILVRRAFADILTRERDRVPAWRMDIEEEYCVLPLASVVR